MRGHCPSCKNDAPMRCVRVEASGRYVYRVDPHELAGGSVCPGGEIR